MATTVRAGGIEVRLRMPVASQRREWLEGWLFAAPFVIGFLLFTAGPMVFSLYLVTQQWDMLSPSQFVWLENVRRLFQDPLLLTSLTNTAVYTFVSVPLQLILAFLLAFALNQRLRAQSLYRTVFYLPSIVPAVATAVVWRFLFNPDFGLINTLLGVFGIPTIRWLFDPTWAKPALILMSLWGIGPDMVILLAALQNVPQELLEAAEIDGADAFRRLRTIIIPMVSPAIFFCLVMGIIGTFQVFTSAFVMTSGGPQNSTLFMVLYIYKHGFQMFDMGYGATLSWLLFCIIMAFTLLQLKLGRGWVYYEASR